jgi:hypothetical protein
MHSSGHEMTELMGELQGAQSNRNREGSLDRGGVT